MYVGVKIDRISEPYKTELQLLDHNWIIMYVDYHDSPACTHEMNNNPVLVLLIPVLCLFRSIVLLFS